MGELLLPRYLSDPTLISSSAGTYGLHEHAIDPSSARLLSAEGIGSSSFRSRRLTPAMAKEQDLILCFEKEQRKDIVMLAPTTIRRTFMLTDFANMCSYCKQEGFIEGSTMLQRLESVMDNASMIRPMIPEPAEIEDPNRKDFSVFQRAFTQINQSLQTIAASVSSS
jgi:protein-tyrosine phosphatase